MFPLLKNKAFDDSEVGIALKHLGGQDCHVGIYWKYGSGISILHFVASQKIVFESASTKHDYRFERLRDFNPVYLPTLAVLAPKILKNKLNLFKIAVKFDGYKFDLSSGLYLSPSSEGNHLNCAAFVLALLGTFNFDLIDWKSWPEVTIPKAFMEAWLSHHGLDLSLVDKYRKDNRQIRGAHVATASLITHLPATLDQVNAEWPKLAEALSKK